MSGWPLSSAGLFLQRLDGLSGVVVLCDTRLRICQQYGVYFPGMLFLNNICNEEKKAKEEAQIIFIIYIRHVLRIVFSPNTQRKCVYLSIYLSIDILILCLYAFQGAFFAHISDAAIGGTYLTLLNTVSNFGSAWPKSLVLYSVDKLTHASCVAAGGALLQIEQSCSSGAGMCIGVHVFVIIIFCL